MGELSDYLIQHDANFRKPRLPALYSDFRPQKSLNPDGYQANVSAWRGALSLLASRGLLSPQGAGSSLLVLDLDASLPRSLENRQFGQPLALGTVIREATAGRDLLPLHDFIHAPQSIYERRWSELPWKAMYWALRQVGILDASRGEDTIPKGRFVIVENVEAASKALAHRVVKGTSRFGRVFTKTQLRTELLSKPVGHQQLSETDVDVLLKFLSRDKGMIEYDGQTIRFREDGDPMGITEEDAAIASIKELTASLKHQANLLDARVDQLSQEARNAVVRRNRITALAALKSKKLAESSLSKRYATLNQLEEVAAKIEQASDQVQLIKIMEASAGALRNLNTKVGGADRVDSAMDRLREQMNDTDELAAILAESTGALDENEIDEELEELERQETLKHEEAQRRKKEAEADQVRKELENLPSVPIDREGVRTPTSETGIAHLSLSQPGEKTAEEAP